MLYVYILNACLAWRFQWSYDRCTVS